MALVGYLAFHDRELAAGFDVRMFIDLPEPEMVRRRLTRPYSDVNVEPYLSTVMLPAHRRWVMPQREIATHVLDGMRPPHELADKAAAILAAHLS